MVEGVRGYLLHLCVCVCACVCERVSVTLDGIVRKRKLKLHSRVVERLESILWPCHGFIPCVCVWGQSREGERRRY